MSGREDRPSKRYPDLRHGTRGEPTGLPHYTDDELTEMAETQARQDQAMHRRPWWQRWFGRRGPGKD